MRNATHCVRNKTLMWHSKTMSMLTLQDVLLDIASSRFPNSPLDPCVGESPFYGILHIGDHVVRLEADGDGAHLVGLLDQHGHHQHVVDDDGMLCTAKSRCGDLVKGLAKGEVTRYVS